MAKLPKYNVYKNVFIKEVRIERLSGQSQEDGKELEAPVLRLGAAARVVARVVIDLTAASQ